MIGRNGRRSPRRLRKLYLEAKVDSRNYKQLAQRLRDEARHHEVQTDDMIKELSRGILNEYGPEVLKIHQQLVACADRNAFRISVKEDAGFDRPHPINVVRGEINIRYNIAAPVRTHPYF